ncbi:MAG TPA: DUF3291 domain-containing protein [Candidatus Limnocylindrales bacterium]|nr:DUF3291 domain-containing protein [Candidatus Limnocylindrales bacterium]
MAEWEIAQLNVGRARAPTDSEIMAGFVVQLDAINALAERTPGFVWRLKGDNGNATGLLVTQDPQFIVNLTVWRSIDDLWAYTYRSEHNRLFMRRFEWFERRETPSLVLWWVPAGRTPTTTEALDRLRTLTELGPTPEAFTFRQRFPPPGE